MKNRTIILCALLLLSFVFESCDSEKTNWEPKYDAKATEPYGFSLFTFGVQKAFPKQVHLSTISTTAFSDDAIENAAYIVLANTVEFSPSELWQLDEWMRYGNNVVIIAEELGTDLSHYLNIGAGGTFSRSILNYNQSSLFDTIGHNYKIQAYNKFQSQKIEYTFNGFKVPLIASGFTINEKIGERDALHQSTFILSKIDSNTVNAFAADVGEGRIIVVCNPMLLSNYALLQGQNKSYLEHLLGYLQPNIDKVYLALGHTRSAEHSNFGVLWQHRGTRTAIIVALIGLLLYIANNMRRRQNIIPIIKPLNNDSKSFIETIAGLYVEKRNNKNMAHKIVQHFLEYTRSQYRLNTKQIDNVFRDKLASRSGNSIADTAKVLQQVNHVLEDTILIDDQFLTQLYTNVQKFYKQ